MFWIVLTILLLIAAIGGWRFRLHQVTRQGRFGDVQETVFGPSKDGVPVVTIGAVVLWLLLSAMLMVNTVAAGHIGLVKTFRDYTGQQGSGIHMKAPWQSVDEVNGKVQKATIEMDKGNSAVSSETQPVYATLVINYQVQLDKAMDLYREVGPEYYQGIIEPRVAQAFKSITVKYKTAEVAPNREKIRKEAEEIITAELAPYGITVNGLLVKNLSFSQEFLDSIERKQVATQDALAAKEKVAQVKAEADQKIEQARGEAESLRIKGDQLRKSPEVIQLEAIEKLNPNVEVIYLPEDADVLIGGGALKGETAGAGK